MSVKTDIVNLIVNVNGDSAKKEFYELKGRAIELTQQLKEMKKGTQEYIAASNELKEVNKKLADMRGQMDIATLSVKDLRAEIRQMKFLRDQLDPASEAFGNMSEKIKIAEARMRDLQQGGNFLSKTFDFLKKEALGFGVVMLGALGIDYVIGKIGNIIKSNADLSDSLADIRKATGMSAEAVDELNKSLKNIDTRTPREQLREMAVGLGQAGQEVNAEAIEALDKINVALGDEFGKNAQEITNELTILRNNFTAFKTDNYGEDIMHIGNALNVLGASGQATAPVITDMANRMAGVLGTFGVSAGKTLGLAAAMQELGINVERGSTAVVKLSQRIAANPEMFAKMIGAKSKEEIQSFIDLVNNDMLGALQLVAEKSKTAGTSNTDFAKTLKELDADGSGVSELLSKIAANGELVSEKMNLASGSMTENASVQDEFAIKNENFAAKVEKLKKKFSDLWSSKAVMAFSEAIVDGMSRGIDAIIKFVNYLQSISHWIKAIAAAYATYLIVLNRSIFLMAAKNALLLAEKIIINGSVLAIKALILVEEILTGQINKTTIAKLRHNAAMLLNPYAAAAAAIVGITVLLAGFIKKHQEAVMEAKLKKIEVQYNTNIKAIKDDTKEGLKELNKLINSNKPEDIKLGVSLAKQGVADAKKELNRLHALEVEYVNDTKNLSKEKANILNRELSVEYNNIFAIDESLALKKKKLAGIRQEYEAQKVALEQIESTYQNSMNKQSELDSAAMQQQQEKNEQAKQILAEEKQRQEENLKRLEDTKTKILDLRRELQLDTFDEQTREIEEVKDKYSVLIKEAKGFATQIKELEELRGQEIELIQEKYRKKELENQRKQYNDLINAIEDNKEKEWESTLTAQQREEVQMAQQYEKLLLMNDKALKAKAITEQQHKEIEQGLYEAHYGSLLLIQEKYRLAAQAEQDKSLQELQEKRKQFFEGIKDFNPDEIDPEFNVRAQRDIELEELRLHNEAIEQAIADSENAKTITEEEAGKLRAENRLKYAAMQEAIEKDSKQKMVQASLLTANAIVQGTVGLFQILLEEKKKYTKAEKAAAVTQIGTDTALAISALVKNSEANPTNAVTGGIAGALQYAAGIIRIFTNIASAVKILTSETVPVAQKKKGGFTKVRGADDGKAYDAQYLPGMEHGYINNNSLVLAGEDGKQEYFVNNQALQVPAVKYIVDGIESLSRGKISVPDFEAMMMATAPQKAQGGYTTNTSAPASFENSNNTLADLSKSIMMMNEILSKGIKSEAYIKDQSIYDFMKREAVINELYEFADS